MLKVDTVVTVNPWGHGEENPDHRVTGRAVEEACWMGGMANDFPEHVRRFLLGDSGEYGKEHNLRYAERFYYTDQRPPAKAEVDEYVEKNAVSI
jgi:LmbE family N-acetylglucosaminyl deacetylase